MPTSKVWLHFTKAKDKEEAKCNLCCKIISCKGENTASMVKHISIVHQITPNAVPLTVFELKKTPPTPSAAAAAAGGRAQSSSSSTQSSSGKHTKTCRKSRQLKIVIQSLKSVLKSPG